MTDCSLYRLRVLFVKQGRLAFLSHLEIARALERIIRRADLPYAVSRGFSPHMRIAFGSALPVGVGGTAEVFEVFLTSYVAPAHALARLQEMSPKDLMPYEAKMVSSSATAVSVAFPYSFYKAVFVLPGKDFPGEATEESPDFSLVVPETIVIQRENKQKEYSVKEYLARPCTLCCLEDGRFVLGFVLQSKSTGSLRPDLLVKETLKASGIGEKAVVQSVTRVAQQETL